jgi:hypothetical protein
MHQEIRSKSMTTVLLVTLAMAMSQGLATAQSSSIQREAPSTPSITVLDGSEASPASFVQHGPLNLEKTTPCSLSVPDAISQPSPEGDGTTPTGTHVSYLPLSDRCKFRLFLRTTYSPYTFASAGFEATEAQASGQWPHYGGGMQGWRKRFGATLANTESRRFIQEYALSTILHQDPRYFPSPKKRALAAGMVFRNQSGDYEERPRRECVQRFRVPGHDAHQRATQYLLPETGSNVRGHHESL